MYYLLGAVDNYSGRNYDLKNSEYKGYILKVNKDETNKIKRLEEVSGLKFSSFSSEILKDWVSLNSDHYEKEINKYYSFSKMKGIENYNGKLNLDKVLKGTKNQLLSYLLGSFLIHGSIKIENDGGDQYEVYQISVANAQPQFEVLKSILKELGVYTIKEEIWYKTPFTFHVKFSPDSELKTLLDKELAYQNNKYLK
ncbi:hypothetical protein OF897_05230 [Chryseobacterium formosus]|uniref:Homing endonuclease LAGLIDADG domain-containing protein n=1 Tax=Chryseobacterium formosus TaxID=1537363 RepID=A0ABT3XMF9_9FLAO|nr:hypothetical protein [Chryseobacterium formosus]MCX8523319.1 hypothetical protein [Chryseobacterium formosus]